MNRSTATILLLALACSSASAASDKLDMAARIAVDYYNDMQLHPDRTLVKPIGLPVDFTPASRSASAVAAIVTLAGEASELEQAGLEVVSTAGNMAIVRIPVDRLAEAAELACVRSIAIGHTASPSLNLAREATGMTLVHSGTDLPAAFDGSGVVAGIFDNGFDPHHLNFKDKSGKRRIRRMWTVSNGEATELVENNSIASFTTDNRTTTHGTHTLGCMAGSFNSTGGQWARVTERGLVVKATSAIPFYGMAPGADLAVGAGSLSNANILCGVQNMVDYARSVGKPAVINLSLGSVVGSHDPYDPFNAYLDELGKDAIICVAAGNDGNKNISISRTLTSADPTVRTIIEPGSNTSFNGIIDVWSDSNEPLKVTPMVYNVLSKEIVYSMPTDRPDMNVTVATSNYTNPDYKHDDAFDRAFSGSSWQIRTSSNPTSSNRYNCYLQYNINFNSATNAGGLLAFALMVEGKPGTRVDITNHSSQATFSSRAMTGWTSGSPEFSISSMAAGRNVLAVGAWNTRNTWPTLSGSIYRYTATGYDVDKVAGYSSYGTLTDGRSLPDLCAPGSGIVSSVSTHYVNNTYKTDDNRNEAYSAVVRGQLRSDWWGVMQGTSMACPIVAGGIATWLEANPALTIDEVRRIARETATVDDNVTAGPSAKWGAGKFNAYEGLKAVIRAGVGDVRADNGARFGVRATGHRQYEVFVPGARTVEVSVMTVAGGVASCLSGRGDTADLDLSDLPAGLYILSVNGLGGTRVLLD